MSNIEFKSKKTEGDEPTHVWRSDPPLASRFQKGRSGNLKGRPLKKHKPHELLGIELAKPIKLNIGGEPIKVSRHMAILKQLSRLVREGHPGAWKLYRQEVETALRANP